MLKFELKKILKNKILWVGTIAVLIYSFSMFYSFVLAEQIGTKSSEDHTSPPEIIYSTRLEKINLEKEIAEPYIGKELTDDLVLEVLLLNEDLENEGILDLYIGPHKMIDWNFSLKPYIEGEELSEGYRIVTIDNEKYKVETVEHFYEENNIENPIIFNYGEGWMALTRRLGWSLIAGLAVIVITLATVFSSEHKFRMCGQILSTKNGKNKDVKAKILASLIVAFSMFFIITICNMVMYLSVYGLAGGNTDITLSMLASMAFSHSDIPGITVMEVFVSVVVCGFVVYFAVTMLTILISSLLKNDYVSVVISSVLFFLPMIIVEMFNVFNTVWLSNTLNLMPVNILNIGSSSKHWHWPITNMSILNDVPCIFGISFVYIVVGLICILVIRKRMKTIQDV